jgi:SAM-dependent methyltransferase
VSEEQPRTRPSSPDSDDIDVTTDEPVDPKAARRARRAKAKLALRIPDDEVMRPQAKSNGGADTEETPAVPPVRTPQTSNPEIRQSNPEIRHDSIKPNRIISVGPPPPDKEPPKEIDDDLKTQRRIPSAPPTEPLDDDAIERISSRPPPAPPTVIDAAEAAGDDIDVPVDEDEPEYRPRMPTIPSNPPPAPGMEARRKSQPPPKPKQPSDDALEIDDVEAAAVLSSRPPPARANMVPPVVPAAPRVPTIAAKPPAPAAPITPLIPADALSSTPSLTEEPKTRPRAKALLDDEEAGAGLEEVEPDRTNAPPSVDSGDEIDTSELLAIPTVPAAARPVSTPPKPAPAAKPPPKDAPKIGGMIPIVAPSIGSQTPASGVPSPLAPPPLHEGLVPRRRARPWWEELFNDDFIRTMPKFTEEQVGAEVDFIEDSLGVARGGTLLDLGCGTGRQAVELSRRGYSVVGFDLSLSMLARAGEEAQEQNQKINFVQGDMREMTFEDAFDGIYCWGSSFGYFEEEKNAHVVGKIHKALRQGGQFLLDVVSRDFAIKQAPSLAWFEGEGCVCMDEMVVDWITSRMRVKRTMMLDDGRSKEIEYSIRIYSLHELGKMLHDHGFRVAEVSGRIQTPGVFFGPDSPRTLILAEKR